MIYAHKKFKQFFLIFYKHKVLKKRFHQKSLRSTPQQITNFSYLIWFFAHTYKCNDFRRKLCLLKTLLYRKRAVNITWVSKSTVEFEYLRTSICHHQTCIQHAQKRSPLISQAFDCCLDDIFLNVIHFFFRNLKKKQTNNKSNLLQSFRISCKHYI